MDDQQNEKKKEEKSINGVWILLLFVTLLFAAILIGWLN